MATARRKKLRVFAILAVGVAALFYYLSIPNIIRVAIAPYPNLAMIANARPLGLERKYGTRIELITMTWKEMLPAIASAQDTVDLGFTTYIEYIHTFENSPDPVLFIPLFAFKDGTFITYKAEVPGLDGAAVRAPQSTTVWRWLDFRIGAQRGSIFELMLFHLANTHGDDFRRVRIVDTPTDQGLAAAEQGSLDITAIGLTPLAEVEKRGGRAVLTMDDVGFADLTGFIVKKSFYTRRRRDIDNVIRMWFESVTYVFRDIDRNSQHSRAYLDRNAPKPVTLEDYKKALSQEYFPITRVEARLQLIEPSGRFSAKIIGPVANDYLVRNGIRKEPAKLPPFP